MYYLLNELIAVKQDNIVDNHKAVKQNLVRF